MTRYALVPVEATEGMTHCGAQTMDYPSVFMGGPSHQNRRLAPKVWSAMLAASPGQGAVTAAQLEAATEAHWVSMMKDWDRPTAWSELDAEHKAERVGSMRAALTALGLQVQP